MSCSSHSVCGPDYKQLEMMVKNILFDMLNDGTIQPGLKACEGDDFLGKARRVVLCETLADMICNLIEEGIICIPKIEALTMDCATKQLTLALSGNGQMWDLTADLSCLGGGGIADGNTKIKSTSYEAASGKFSIEDTDGNRFDTIITMTPVEFLEAGSPNTSNMTGTPTTIVGGREMVLGKPDVWLQVKTTSGKTVRIPAYE